MNFKLNYIEDNIKKSFGEKSTLAVTKFEKERDFSLTEHTVKVTNNTAERITVCECFPFSKIIEGEYMDIVYYTSYWGTEYTPVQSKVISMTLEGREGRCSSAIHPYIFILNADGTVHMALHIAWSGNWKIQIEALEYKFKITAGMNNDDFQKELAPGESYECPRVITVFPKNKTIDEVTKAFSDFHKKFNGIENSVSKKLPVEWNHWWSYEDYEINETVFLGNVDKAAKLGFEAVVLDAGWYGETKLWYAVRGDWHNVNKEKFPGGIRYLSDYVHGKNMYFGLWCEIEALGVEAELNKLQPQLMAKRDGEPLGYVCMGNEAARKWAFETLDRMIIEYNLDWIKLDFNLEPWQGCNCKEHGHTQFDGLYEHYLGYYKLLDDIRAKHPHVLLENCGSGGRRMDMEILRHTHATYLSDRDCTEDKMRMYEGALSMLPPRNCLHWSWSQSKTDDFGKGPFPAFIAYDSKYKEYELDFHMRGGMLGWLGFSHKLVEFDKKTDSLFERHIAFYKEIVKEFILEGDVYRQHDNAFKAEKDRYIFQYHIKEKDKSLFFVFNYKDGMVTVPVVELQPEQMYEVTVFDNDHIFKATGAALMGGICLNYLRKEESSVILIVPVE